MRGLARWLMVVFGLLALLSIARIAVAADAPVPAPVQQPATPGIADEVAAIVDTLTGRDRGEAVSDAAHRQGGPQGDKEPQQPPAPGGSGK